MQKPQADKSSLGENKMNSLTLLWRWRRHEKSVNNLQAPIETFYGNPHQQLINAEQKFAFAPQNYDSLTGWKKSGMRKIKKKSRERS